MQTQAQKHALTAAVKLNSLIIFSRLPILLLDVLLRCLESLERKASDGSEQQETSAALKEVTDTSRLRNCLLISSIYTVW